MSKQVQEGSVLVMVEDLILDQPSHTKKQKHTLYKNIKNNDLKELERSQKQAETRGGMDTLKKLRALFFMFLFSCLILSLQLSGGQSQLHPGG